MGTDSVPPPTAEGKNIPKGAVFSSTETVESTAVESTSNQKPVVSSSNYSSSAGVSMGFGGGSGLSVLGFSNPFAKMSTLDFEIDRIQRIYARMDPSSQKIAKERIKELVTAKACDEAAAKISIKREDFIPLIAEGRRKVIQGTLEGDKETFQSGKALLEALYKYQGAEFLASKTRQVIKGLYPKDSPEVFRVDFSGYEGGKYGYPKSWWEKQTIVQEYSKLFADPDDMDSATDSGSTDSADTENMDEDNLEIRVAVDNLLEDCKEAEGLSGVSADATDGADDPELTIEDVELATAEINDLYGNPDIKIFFKRMQEAEEKKSEGNEGHRTINQLKEAFASLGDLKAVLDNIKASEKLDPVQLNPERIESTKTVLAEKITTYKTYLEDEKKRKLEEAKLTSVTGSCMDGCPGLDESKQSLAATDAAADLSKEIKSIEDKLAALQALNVKSTDAATKAKTVSELKKVAEELLPLKEACVRKILNSSANELLNLESGHHYEIAQAVIRLSLINATDTPSIEDRKNAYSEVFESLQKLSVTCVLDAQINKYEEAYSQMDTADTHLSISKTLVIEPLDAIGDFLVGDTVSNHYTFEVTGYDAAPVVLGKYRAIKAMLTSDNMETRAKGYAAFNELQAASVHQEVLEGYKGATISNSVGIGALVVGVSFLTAGLMAEFAGAFIGTETAAGSAALYGISGTAFTVSHHVFSAVAYRKNVWDEVVKMGKDPVGLGGEILMNAAFFKVMGKSMEVFKGLYAKGLEVLAESTVVGSFGKALTTTAGAGSEALVKAAVEEEALRLGQTFASNAAMTVGGTAWEAGSLLSTNFVITAGRLASMGDKDAVKHAWEMTFSMESLAHNAAFMTMMKCVGVLSEPLTVEMSETVKNAILGKDFKESMTKLNDRINGDLKALQEFAVTRKGDFKELLKNFEISLKEQESILNAIPAGYRNKDLVAWNKEMLDEISIGKFEVAIHESLFETGNKFGIVREKAGSDYVYDPENASSLASTLRMHPLVEPGSVQNLGGGIFVARFTPANGIPQAVFFTPKFRPALAVANKPVMPCIEIAF